MAVVVGAPYVDEGGEAAVKLNVGEATVETLVAMGKLEGTYFKTLHEGLYIPGDFELGDSNA